MTYPANTVSSSGDGNPGGAQTGTLTWNHTVGAAETVLAGLFHSGTLAGTNPYTSVSYNGIALSLVAFHQDGFEQVISYVLNAPSTGTHAFSAPWDGGSGGQPQIFANAISVEGASATFSAEISSIGPGANPSITDPDSVSGDLVIGMLSTDTGNVSATTEAGTLIGEIEDIGSGDSDFNDQYVIATGANTVISWTSSAPPAGTWMAQVFIILPSATHPTITAQPVAVVAEPGASVSFSVSATSSGGTLTYQWQENSSGTFTNIGGETTSSLSRTAPAAGNAYAVRCIVTDSNGSINSEPASLVVLSQNIYAPWRVPNLH